jgi:hypothetical protein
MTDFTDGHGWMRWWGLGGTKPASTKYVAELQRQRDRLAAKVEDLNMPERKALLEACCRAACAANKLDPDEEIRHPYNRAYGVESKKRWQWLADPTVCPEITAVIETALTFQER